MKKERLEKALNGLVGDVVMRLDELGKEGITNPFDSIVSIVFRKFPISCSSPSILYRCFFYVDRTQYESSRLCRNRK